MQFVNKVYVFDTGLSKETRNYINLFPGFELIDTKMSIDSKKIHDAGWAKNTYSKTKFLKQIIEKDNMPTFMIDSDAIFVDNFQDLIDWNADLVACDSNRDGFSKHIGSFFGAIN